MANKEIPVGTTVTPADGDKILVGDASDSFRLKDVLVSGIRAFLMGAPGAIGGSTAATSIAVSGDAQIDGRVEFGSPWFYDEFWSGDDPIWTTRTTTGSLAAQNSVNGWQRFTTGAVATNEESLDWNDICPFINTGRPTFEIRLKLEQITNIEVDVGLMEASGGSDDDYIMIMFDASAAATWKLEASAAGTPTSDVGAAADTNEVKLRFEFTSDTALEWFIDDVSQGTISSNCPTAQLQPIIAVRTEEGAAHYIDVDYVLIYQDRS